MPIKFGVDKSRCGLFTNQFFPQVTVELVIDSRPVLGSELVHMYSPTSRVSKAVSVVNREDTLGYLEIDWSSISAQYDGSFSLQLTELVFTGFGKSTGLGLFIFFKKSFCIDIILIPCLSHSKTNSCVQFLLKRREFLRSTLPEFFNLMQNPK